ncbi:hypothetical protein [Vibrio sp. CUB2]|uniref:hypothetical protein n=1 Tax=Vibrio sp. CUB2 TaxID=2315233 RepID=UPI000769EDA8|nr:hypothetical protein [Vibrio sp. CUB2]
MNNSTILKHLNQLLQVSGQKAEIDGRYLVFQFLSNCDDRIAGTIDALRDIGDGRSLIMDEDMEKHKDDKYITTLVVATDGVNHIYQNYQAMFNDYFKLAIKGELKAKHRDFFFATPGDSHAEIARRFESLQSWLNLFKSLTRNYIYSSNYNEVCFFLIEEIEEQKKIKSHEFVISSKDTKLNFDELTEFPAKELGFKKQDDAYTVEKKLVCKSALLKTLKGRIKLGDKNGLLSIIMKPTDFIENFDIGYEFYTSKYSIDKFTREIETAKIEYFEKINAIIHDNQAKALSIPVVILGTSLLRSWNPMSAVLIVAAMLLAVFLVVLNLRHKIVAINDCETSAKKALSIIAESTTNENNMENSSSSLDGVFIEIQVKTKAAKKLLNRINIGILVGVGVWGVYLFMLYSDSLTKAAAAS